MSFIKWAGGKGKLSDIIIPFFNFNYALDLYIEPFVGSGAILFKLRPKRAIISDINKNLITTYQVIRSNILELIKLLSLYQDEYLVSLDKKTYYEYKKNKYNELKNKDVLDNVEIASLFIFLNKTCFNGIYRENKSGTFNVPWGKNNKPNICDEPLLLDLSGYLNSADIQIKHSNYEDILNNLPDNSDTIIYLDPPYYKTDTSKFTSYSKEAFGLSEQLKLSENLLRFKKVRVFISNSNCQEVKELYSGLKFIELETRRNLGVNNEDGKSSRGNVIELFFMPLDSYIDRIINAIKIELSKLNQTNK